MWCICWMIRCVSFVFSGDFFSTHTVYVKLLHWVFRNVHDFLKVSRLDRFVSVSSFSPQLLRLLSLLQVIYYYQPAYLHIKSFYDTDSISGTYDKHLLITVFDLILSE